MKGVWEELEPEGNMMMEKERQKEMRRCYAPSSEGREKRPWAKGYGWPMRSRDGKETGSCWRNTACGPMLDFWYPELYNNKICLSHRQLPCGGSVVITPPAVVGDVGLIPGSGRSPGEGNGNPLQYSFLGNPMDRGAWWSTACGVARVGQDLVTKPQDTKVVVICYSSGV